MEAGGPREASADPIGSSGAKMVLQSFLNRSKGAGPLYPAFTSHLDMAAPGVGGCMTRGRGGLPYVRLIPKKDSTVSIRNQYFR